MASDEVQDAPRARALHRRGDIRIRGDHIQMGDATAIRDPAGNVVGQIETMQNGDQVLRNSDNEIRGYYDAEGDFTRDAEQKIVAKGNKLRSMIC
jgi:hypothetical protein